MRAVPPDEFHFPSGATAPAAARLGRALAAAAGGPALLPYAAALEAYVCEPAAGAASLQVARPSRGRALPLHRWLPTFRYPRWSGDVVVVGECTRAAEVELMARLIAALLRSGRTVLYLSVFGREHAALQRHRRAAGWSRACTVARLARGGYRRQFWLHAAAPRRLRRDWAALQPLLAASGVTVRGGALAALRDVALARVLWAILKPRLRFRVALTRTRYQPLSAALLADCLTTEQLSISLQHSIITAPGSFAPLLAKRYLCFGAPSRALLARLEAAAPVRGGGRCDLLAAGAFTDPLPAGLAARAPASVVLIDQSSTWAGRYFGGDAGAAETLPRIAAALAAQPAVRRVVVRLHPGGAGRDAWLALAARWPGRLLVRGGDRPLAADLDGAAAVVGLFSTVLPVAAAAGIPTFFLWQPGWFSTPDLAPFAATQFVAPAALPERLARLLGDAQAFAGECDAARAAGAAYFHGGGAGDFAPSLVEAMLAPLPPAAGRLSASG